MGRCDPGDQILVKNSKCSESHQIEQVHRPHHYEPNTTHLGSNGHGSERYRVLFKMTNRQKKRDADCTVRTVHTDADVAGRTTHGRQLFG
jgi:hypothetical protein